MTVADALLLAELDALRGRVDDMSEAEARQLVSRLGAIRAIRGRQLWEPYPWQVPPATPTTLGMWLMLGGRGTGKTEGAARYVDDHVNGPPCDGRLRGGHRMAIVAPTLGDAVDACVQGPSGLQTINPSTYLRGGRGGTHVYWPSGASARLFGAFTPEDAERLRAGGNRCLVWLEEMAAQRHLAHVLEQTSLGLRIGPNPHYVASTTPKPRQALRDLLKRTDVLVTKGRTEEAIHLLDDFRQALLDRYRGTRLGRQELDAEILDDVEGALWRLDTIKHAMVSGFDPARPWESIVAEVNEQRVAVGLKPMPLRDPRRWVTKVGVDPPGETAECGIVVAAAPQNAIAGRDHAVVLGDYSIAGPPEVWGPAVVAAYRLHGCHSAVVEKNQGGDMVRSTIHNVDGDVVVDKITSTASKGDRAEPISALYLNAWIHHVKAFPELEDQMTTFVPVEDGKTKDSPDRLDALVHVLNGLLRQVPLTGRSAVGVPGRPAGTPAAGPRPRNPLLGR